ncbi:MAG: arsenate reductase ArsC [Gammaproteobacteria bacterium]|nr:arsenate reductase ArsC [Gammaproteobacteria bacterium]
MNILFLCTGNSCRSQMAEGWSKRLAPKTWKITSAGIEEHGKNPYAIKVMAEAGTNISNQESTRLTDEMLIQADLVITVCGHADEHCPVLPAGTRKEYWPLDNPAKASGTVDEILDVFRATRDEVHRRVKDLIARECPSNLEVSDEYAI